MARSNITVARIAETCARLLRKETISSIHNITGLSTATVANAARVMRAHGVPIETRSARRDLKREERIRRYFQTTQLSNRAIAAHMGINLTAVSTSRRRFNIELVRSGGELPKCECGQYLHHARMCGVRQHRNLDAKGVKRISGMPEAIRSDVQLRLVRGETTRSIAARLGLEKHHVQTFLCSLSRAERETRTSNYRISAGRVRASKLTKAIARPRAINPEEDPMFARISRTVSTSIDGALRDDMMQDAYLEYLEGRLKVEQFDLGMKKVRARIFRAFANPWGDVSLDVSNDEGGESWVNAIPDERALEAFDAIR
jgi:hypothetical protein